MKEFNIKDMKNFPWLIKGAVVKILDKELGDG